MRSARRTVEKRWEMTMVVVPRGTGLEVMYKCPSQKFDWFVKRVSAWLPVAMSSCVRP